MAKADLDKQIGYLVAKISGQQFQRCYEDLILAVKIVHDTFPRTPYINEVVEQISQITGRTEKAIKKALARAMNDIWETGNHALLDQLFNCQLTEKPAPKMLIFRMAQFFYTPLQYQLWKDPGAERYGIAVINQTNHEWLTIIPFPPRQIERQTFVDFLNRTQVDFEEVRQLFHGE